LYKNKKVDLRIHFLILPEIENNKVINFKIYLSKLIIVRYTRYEFNLNDLSLEKHLTNFSFYNKDNKNLEDNHFEFS